MKTQVIENRIFNSQHDIGEGGDMIFFSGPHSPDNPYKHDDFEHLIVRNCILDLRSVPLAQQDEAISGVCGANVEMHHTLVIGAKKAMLCGNGDWPEQDRAHGEWLINGCVFINCGRRCPEAQDGVRVTMRNSWVHDWGYPPFSVRAFGAWARTGASIIAENCLFTQSAFFRLPFKEFFDDVGGHFGEAWNDRPSKLRDYLLPGLCRGLTAARGAHVEATSCYTNKRWIRLENSRSPIDRRAAGVLVGMFQQHLHPEYERVLGCSLDQLFKDVAK